MVIGRVLCSAILSKSNANRREFSGLAEVADETSKDDSNNKTDPKKFQVIKHPFRRSASNKPLKELSVKLREAEASLGLATGALIEEGVYIEAGYFFMYNCNTGVTYICMVTEAESNHAGISGARVDDGDHGGEKGLEDAIGNSGSFPPPPQPPFRNSAGSGR